MCSAKTNKAAKPGQIEHLRVVNTQPDHVTVEFALPTEGGGVITHFFVEAVNVKHDSDDKNKVERITRDVEEHISTSMVQVSVHNLSAAETYIFRARAVSSVGEGMFSDWTKELTLPTIAEMLLREKEALEKLEDPDQNDSNSGTMDTGHYQRKITTSDIPDKDEVELREEEDEEHMQEMLKSTDFDMKRTLRSASGVAPSSLSLESKGTSNQDDGAEHSLSSLSLPNPETDQMSIKMPPSASMKF